jgi:cytochrome d ubiquinol oxidase subunit I
MVCLGAHFSAIWIVVAGSWMQTPAGYHIVGEGMKVRAEITDFWAMVFNPSSMDRLIHVVLGCWQAGATLVLSVSAYYLLKRKHEEFAKASMKIALGVALVASIAQLFSGHSSAQIVHQYQPAKLAAIEGHYNTSAQVDLYAAGWVDEEKQSVNGIKIPGALSYLVGGDTKTVIRGLNDFAPGDHPPVQIVFQSFHIMVLVGLFLIALNVTGFIFLLWKKLFTCKPILWVFVFSVFGPQIANQFGWIAAEVGRQPWIVYGLLRTSDALSKNVTANLVMTSLIMFTVIYVLLFVLFIFLLDQKIKVGPEGLSQLPKGHRA